MHPSFALLFWFYKRRGAFNEKAIIIDISYDATEDATTFYFTEDTYEENIGWKFAGNLLDQYSAGDVLNLTFDVLNVGNYQGITFESLDYFEAAYAHNNGAAYPNIQDYQ